MDNSVNRRAFTVASTSLVGGMLLGRPAAAVEQQHSLNELNLVRLGVNALARAPQMSYFADGHRGAALISAHMMCANNQFEGAAVSRISELFHLNWRRPDCVSHFPKAIR